MTSPISGTFVEEVQDGRDARDVARAAGAEDRVRAVARDAEAEDVDRGARDHLVGAQVDREHGVDEAEEARRPPSRRAGRRPRAGLLGHDDAPEAAHQHHALEADVDDAGALREEAAERAERERRRVLERAHEEPGRDDRGHVGALRAPQDHEQHEAARTRPARSARAVSQRRASRRRTAAAVAARSAADVGSRRARAWRARPASARSARRRPAG